MICEKCGKEMTSGFGLAGGGYGVYFFCETLGCDTFVKFQERDAEQKPPESK